ncbi:hypothetical protein SPHINGOR109_70001 [Sphingorhabdus sp. 109]|nr:hypothetical protein SPHINGOR109_70001 [Sphingorhabdus sp. 109]
MFYLCSHPIRYKMEMNFGKDAINRAAYDYAVLERGMGTRCEFTGKQWRSYNGTWGSAGR